MGIGDLSGEFKFYYDNGYELVEVNQEVTEVTYVLSPYYEVNMKITLWDRIKLWFGCK